MHEVNIRSIDLNLLVALKALLEEKHVTKAAKRISLSQPAMSRALGRLRQLFNDPLLVKGPVGLEWSARASELYQPLSALFADLTHMITPPPSDPAKMSGEIIIATRDNEMVTVLPRLIQAIATHAPNLTLRIIQLQGDDFSALENHQIDFILAGSNSHSSVLSRYTLYKDDFVCLVAANNPVRRHFTLETYAAMKHCLVTISGTGPGRVDLILEKKGLKRTTVIRVPNFLAAAYIVAQSDLVVTLPRKIASVLAQQNTITLLKPPLKIPSFPIYLYWHIRNQNNPVHVWLRKIMRELCGNFT